jgi:hypothetical protein
MLLLFFVGGGLGIVVRTTADPRTPILTAYVHTSHHSDGLVVQLPAGLAPL